MYLPVSPIAYLQDTFARACTLPPGQARASIGYLVYKLIAYSCISFLCKILVYNIPYRRARAWPRPSASREQRYLVLHTSKIPLLARCKYISCIGNYFGCK